MGKKKLLAWLGFCAAALAAGGWLFMTPQTPSAVPPQGATTETATPKPGRFEALPERPAFGRLAGRPFEPHSAPSAAPAPQAVPTPVQPAAPPPPPYRVAGRIFQDGAAKVLLARDEALLMASEGDQLEGDYRVESIRTEGVTLVYLPMGVRQELPMTATFAPAEPPRQAQAVPGGAGASSDKAQLRWEGPQRVRTGDKFEVALKVSSPEALRAAPLQLTFDATLLEPIEVRPGRFFAEGTFSYRVIPSGSIFVGGSGKGAPAADAELYIVSFKPIRPANSTELRVSALMLQGTAGRAIVHEQPVAFRTTIVQ